MKNRIWLQLFALLIALFLWFQHMLLKEQTATIAVPLEVVDLPDSLTLMDSDPHEASLIVAGRGVDIMLLSLGDAYLQVSAANAIAGRNVVEVSADDIVAADYVQKHSLEVRAHNNVWFDLDRLERRRIPVQLRFRSEEDRRWLERQNVEVDPQNVYVQGPSKALNRIESIDTEPLSKQPTTDRTLTARLLSPGVLFHLETEQIEVSMSRPELITKDYNQITISNPYEDHFAIFPGKVNLLISGARQSFEQFSRANIHVTLADNQPDVNGEIRLSIVLPIGFEVVSYTPQTVQVISHEPIVDPGD